MAETTERRSIQSGKLVSPASFAHVVLKTRNIEQSLSWYQKVLGGQVVFRNDFICFLTYDDEHHRVAFVQLPPDAELPLGSGGVDHFAYSYNDLGELLGTYYRLKAEGILPVRMINHGPTISFYYRDPNGIKLELQVDNFSTKAEASDYFHTSEFAENPIGVFVDPDQLRADWEAGVPWERLRVRPPMPEGKTIADMRSERS